MTRCHRSQHLPPPVRELVLGRCPCRSAPFQAPCPQVSNINYADQPTRQHATDDAPSVARVAGEGAPAAPRSCDLCRALGYGGHRAEHARDACPSSPTEEWLESSGMHADLARVLAEAAPQALLGASHPSPNGPRQAAPLAAAQTSRAAAPTTGQRARSRSRAWRTPPPTTG